MSYSVYLLFSRSHLRTYSGHSSNLTARLRLHNDGRVRSTKTYRPWILLHSEVYQTRAEAMRREKWLKSRKGREFIAGLISGLKNAGGLSVSSA